MAGRVAAQGVLIMLQEIMCSICGKPRDIAHVGDTDLMRWFHGTRGVVLEVKCYINVVECCSRRCVEVVIDIVQHCSPHFASVS